MEATAGAPVSAATRSRLSAVSWCLFNSGAWRGAETRPWPPSARIRIPPRFLTPSCPRPPHSELACVYAALICADDGVEISADNIATIVKAAGVEVESYWPSLFAKLAEKKDIMELVTAVGAGGGGGAVAAGGGAAAAGGAAPAEEEKVEEEEDEDMGFSLFD
jgi:large subunit ribosomal protein LP1